MEEEASKKFYTYENVRYSCAVTSDVLDQVKTFPLRPDDVIIVSFPRSGSAWLGEIVWLLVNNVDVTATNHNKIVQRAPFLEWPSPNRGRRTIDELQAMSSQRLMKTHLMPCFIEQQMNEIKPRVIFLLRNPKDQLVSLFHFYRMNSMLGPFTGSWDDFYELYDKKELVYGDWFDFTSAWLSQGGLLLVSYEQLQDDISKQLRRLADFLNPKVTEDDLGKIAQHVSFENMKTNPNTNFEWLPTSVFNKQLSHYYRKGLVGDWRSHFTRAQTDKMDEKYKALQKQFPHLQSMLEP